MSSSPPDDGPEDAAAAFQRLHPRAFYQRFVEQKVRPDGRGLEEPRECRIEKGAIKAADGSAIVEMGFTKVACGIRFMIGEAPSDHPKEGKLMINVKLLPVCSPEYNGRGASATSVSLQAFLERVVIGSKVINLNDLCIEEETACFVLCADIVCLGDDGNLTDASLLSLIEALKDLKLPHVEISQDAQSGEKSKSSSGREVVQIGSTRDIPLALNHFPFSTTFGMFQDILLVDPTNEEAQVLDGTVSVVVNENEEIVSLHKPNGPALSSSGFDKCMELAIAMKKKFDDE